MEDGAITNVNTGKRVWSCLQKAEEDSVLPVPGGGHLTFVLSMEAKNRRKSLIFTLIKMIENKRHFFSVFGRTATLHDLISDLRVFPVV